MNVGILFGLVRSLVSFSTAIFLYVGILFSFSTSARPCSMYVGILFGLSTAMFFVYFGIWAGGGVISTLVQMVRPYSFMLVFYLVFRTLIPLVRPCSMYHYFLE